MSMPLELTIHEYDRAQYGYADPAGWLYPDIDVDYFTEQKRLTEAELAAEYWRAQSEYLQEATFITTDEQAAARVGTLMEMQAATLTLHRFATHPHYFEATEPESDTE